MQFPLWKCNTRSRTTTGLIKSQQRFNVSSSRSWGGAMLEWTVGKVYLASRPLVRPFIIF